MEIPPAVPGACYRCCKSGGNDESTPKMQARDSKQPADSYVIMVDATTVSLFIKCFSSLTRRKHLNARLRHEHLLLLIDTKLLNLYLNRERIH
ncbi:hypothetical protein BBBOND_0208090 [Babesia bigemina]|uniref:Uncharacterized protein n=1 Tax=Babesia bigemina TaxID=5866 RepID=A0A061DCM4_BABBI|nr:hypothetical protein BBBOND_0208090 [Babesia bigemina]CDR95655.1 hypothetical protein BBBOND_0208090 [Babesia bigemina]|eukprot:XP_012767841.1 hypothetical protein BBBOND_0208090 [Babesia bigemina]